MLAGTMADPASLGSEPRASPVRVLYITPLPPGHLSVARLGWNGCSEMGIFPPCFFNSSGSAEAGHMGPETKGGNGEQVVLVSITEGGSCLPRRAPQGKWRLLSSVPHLGACIACAGIMCHERQLACRC